MGICCSAASQVYEIPMESPPIALFREEIKQSLEPAQYDENKVIYLQSFVRGYLARKHQTTIQSPKVTAPSNGETVEPAECLIIMEPESNLELINQNRTSRVQQKLPPILMKNGGIYNGNWLGGQPYGKGRYQLHDGIIDGIWKNGFIQDQGIYHNGKETYKGSWSGNQFHGFGAYHYKDGRKYEGKWENNLPHGRGKETYTDGSIYEGQFHQGLKQSNGHFLYKDGSQYQGQFRNDKFHGYGKMIWPHKQRVYEGQWVDGMKHGEGAMLWADGRTFKGQYYYGHKQGYGEMNFPDNRQYRGFWHNGQQDGSGIYKNSAGIERKGLWKLGVNIGWE